MSGDSVGTREALRRQAALMEAEGIPLPSLRGSLFRPQLALLASGPLRESPEALYGALAIEMVHEASLLHDDILDRAATRRGEPTLVARAGVSKALVAGDHLLTSAYTVAQRVGCAGFLGDFIQGVADTVQGEMEQGRRAGERLTLEDYTGIVSRKTGSLFGCALGLGARLRGQEPHAAWTRLGRDLGTFYQKIDDLLDYVPEAGTGKPPLQDARQRKWTWPLQHAIGLGWPCPEATLDTATLQRCVAVLEGEAEEMIERAAALDLDSEGVRAVTERWLAGCRAWVPTAAPALVVLRNSPTEEVLARAAALDGPASQRTSFRLHSKSFSFASRLFPREVRNQVAGVYAYCRFTDDLVDEAPAGEEAETERLLDAWAEASRRAYDGERTGCALLDGVMGHMAEQDVPFGYARQLIEGVRMDLRPRHYHTMAELRVYSYRVASVVGGWLTELFGVRNRWVLRRAAALGHAMQLTNILRDVGEDLALGRLYLPIRGLEHHGLSPSALEELATGRLPLPRAYVSLIQELMAIAEADYAAAFEALPYLPGFFQRPVAVAARVYMGIHDSIRANGYDNLSRRAHTSAADKLRLAGAGLLDLSRARRSADDEPPKVEAPSEPWIPADLEEAVA